MTRGDVERFFKVLSREYPKPVRILLIGGGASIVQAEPRDTEDLDFEIRASIQSAVAESDRGELVRAIEQAKFALGIKVQFTDEIGRWSMIPWPDYQRNSRLWKRFGSCSVFVLNPEVYAISKLVRGTDTDHDDIVKVMKYHPGSWKKLAVLSGRALREAPMSDVLHLFRQQVEHFFERTAPRIWGPRFKPGPALALFAMSYRKSTRGR